VRKGKSVKWYKPTELSFTIQTTFIPPENAG